jgi:integrase
MPRRAKGPRLYLREGRAGRDAVWVIRDGSVEVSTRCGPEQQAQAERRLGDYIAEKFKAPVLKADSRRDPAQVLVAEVVALYSQDKAAGSGLDAATFDRFIANLLAWWGDKTLSDVKRSTCQAYAAHRMAQADARYKDPTSAPRVSSETARRELEQLQASIGHWHGEDTLTTRPVVWLPDKPESPREALTRSQAAALLKASMGYRLVTTAVTGGEPERRWTRLGASAVANRAHLRRFILIGLYTGTRHSAIRALLWEEALTQAWVDLDKGMIYRRGRGERETTKRRPVVKLPRRLLAHMRRWRAMDSRPRDAAPPVSAVLHHGGRPIAGKIRTGFAGCVRDAGLPEEITPHWLRHTAATWLMEAGVDLWDAAGYLGMSVTTLEKHYGHHRHDHQAGAVRAIGGKR